MKNIKELESYTEKTFNLAISSNQAIKDFHSGKKLSKEKYIRHIIEGVNRIHANNEIDTLALLDATKKKNNNISKKIAQYLAEEISHDEIISTDLIAFGIKENQLYSTDFFFSTKLLIGFLKYSIENDGYLPSIVWNWFIEWYSDKYNPTIVAAASILFGPSKTKGMESHLQIDEDLNHTELLGETVSALYLNNKNKVEEYILNYVALVKMYFEELLN